jgi:glycosyltransferase involved in cell wall biosynthesis
MAMGKPVVGSNLGGNPETIDDGNTGYIFKNKDSSQLKEIIKKLYYNEELIEKLGRNARRVVEEKYSKETYLEKLLQIYDSLLNEN